MTDKLDEYILYSLSVIKPVRVREYGRVHARAAVSLEQWLKKAQMANWKSFSEVRMTFRNADQVRTASGKPVLVFNIGGNSYRLICAAHFNRNDLYVLRFFTHAEYSKNQWKKEL